MQNTKFHIYSNSFEEKHNNLINLGYKHTGFIKDIHKSIQPSWQPVFRQNVYRQQPIV